MLRALYLRANKEQSTKYKDLLDHRAIRNQRVLWHDDDAVAYEVRTTRPISLENLRLIQQPRVLPDARVLVDDGLPDDCSLPYPNARQSLAEIAEVLNRKGVPPAHGTNRWTAAMVRKAYVS